MSFVPIRPNPTFLSTNFEWLKLSTRSRTPLFLLHFASFISLAYRKMFRIILVLALFRLLQGISEPLVFVCQSLQKEHQTTHRAKLIQILKHGF